MSTKKKFLVIANWKMNPEKMEEVSRIVSPIKRLALSLKKTEVVFAPSFLHIATVGKMILKSKKLFLGAQDAHVKQIGSYTGSVSSAMLKDLKVKYVILGHSERRAVGETNGEVNAKIKTVLSIGLTPVVCIGEKVRDRDGTYLQEVKAQIKETLAGLSLKDIMSLVIAYEPVWAIGKSFREGMSGTDMHEMSLIIKKILGDLFGEDYSRSVAIMYGGSVEVENALDLITKGDVQGFLVGHASLEPDKFKQILKIVDAVK